MPADLDSDTTLMPSSRPSLIPILNDVTNSYPFPSQQPTGLVTAASIQEDEAAQPTSLPSARPTQRKMEETAAPTSTPSTAPMSAPTPVPTISPTPRPSAAPSFATVPLPPTAAPSGGTIWPPSVDTLTFFANITLQGVDAVSLPLTAAQQQIVLDTNAAVMLVAQESQLFQGAVLQQLHSTLALTDSNVVIAMTSTCIPASSDKQSVFRTLTARLTDAVSNGDYTAVLQHLAASRAIDDMATAVAVSSSTFYADDSGSAEGSSSSSSHQRWKSIYTVILVLGCGTCAAIAFGSMVSCKQDKAKEDDETLLFPAGNTPSALQDAELGGGQLQLPRWSNQVTGQQHQSQYRRVI